MVCTSASSADSRKTAASSPVAEPTSRRSSAGAGRPWTIGSRSAAGSLQPHPAPCDKEVSGTAVATSADLAGRGGHGAAALLEALERGVGLLDGPLGRGVASLR